MKLIVGLLVVAVALGGCTEEKTPRDEGPLAGTCGFPPIRKPPAMGKVSDEFVLDDVEIARTRNYEGGEMVITIYAPYEVNEAYRLYQDQVRGAGWRIVSKETEGFEAEIYLSGKEQLAALQLRSSTCEGKIVVYVSIVDRDRDRDA